MIILAILVGVFLIAIAVPTRGRRRRASRDAARVAMAAAMVFSGVSHFADTAAFVQLLPEFVPGRTPLILATGVFEILLGVGLMAPSSWRLTW